MKPTVKIGSFEIGGKQPLMLIAGPCVIEEACIKEKGASWKVADVLTDICNELNIPFVFKASFDKANRSHVTSYRGPGLERGLDVLEAIKREMQCLVTTDIHEPWQALDAVDVVDIIQIPAFLCRQTDLLIAAASTGCVVNVKKGQFISPQEMRHVATKLNYGAQAAGETARFLFTERGSMLGYNNLVVDMRSLSILQEMAPVVFDATHSVQLPGSNEKSSGGQSEFAFPLARAAVAVGVSAIFMEVHPTPQQAKCDGSNMIALSDMRALLEYLIDLDHFTKSKLQ